MTTATADLAEHFSGGSRSTQKGPKSRRKAFERRTEADKREAREGHQALIADALSQLETPEGMSRWLIARYIHTERMTASNCALAALQAPGRLVGIRPAWLAQGLKPKTAHTLRLTGPKAFWPEAAWTNEAFGIEMPELPVPCAEHCAKLAALWISWPDHSTKGLDAWVLETRPELVEGSPVDSPNDSPEIPF